MKSGAKTEYPKNKKPESQTIFKKYVEKKIKELMNEKNEAWGKEDLSLREQNIPLKILVLDLVMTCFV